MKLTTVLAVIVPTLIGAMAFFPFHNQPDAFHTEAEMAYFRGHQITKSPAPSPTPTTT